MPKKTKKAKLIAEYRRRLQRLDDVSPIEQKTPDQSPQRSVFTLPVSTGNLNTPTTTLTFPESEAQALKKDLIKTLIIVSVFIGFELFLSTILR